MDQFLTWDYLATFAGALAFVILVTQFTKGSPFISKIPTQLWSWVVAMVGLYPAYFFTNQLTVHMAVLIPFNAIIVAFAANGGFEVLNKMFPGLFTKTDE